MYKMKEMKAILEDCAEEQMTHLADTNTGELGEVIDMIKDLEEAMYYHSIRKSMEESTWVETSAHMSEPIKRHSGYIQAKQSHSDKAILMQELEKYMHEISEEMTEILEHATPEEKAYLNKKMTTLMAKITSE